MKKIIIVFVFFLPHLIFAQDINRYDAVFIRSIDRGLSEGDSLAYAEFADPGHSDGPNGIIFEEDSLLIFDSYSGYIKRYFSDSMQYERSYEYENSSNILFLHVFKNYIPNSFLLQEDHSLKIVFLDKDVSFTIRIEEGLIPSSALFINGVLFIWDNTGCVYSLEDPENYTNLHVSDMMNYSQTVEFLNSSQYFDQENIEIDSDYNLLINGFLTTRIYRSFKEFWDNKHSSAISEETHLYTPMNSNSRSTIFLGTDSDKNIYWQVGPSMILVFNQQGWVIDRFLFNDRLSDIYPAISPSGDIYFLKNNYSEEVFELYKIPRQW